MTAAAENLVGQAGIVTGGGGGIGGAIARRLAGLGARLVVSDLTEASAQRVVDEIAGEGGEAVAVAADVRRFADTERLRDVCLERFGRLDFVVANAGIADTSTMAEGDPERWRAVIETNVLGVAYTVRTVLPTLRAQGNGHVVILASISGREVYAGEPIYIASKWAVVGLGGALRKELVGSRVRVTLIEPGLVDTPLTRSNPFAQTLLETTEPLQVDDIARAVAFALLQPPYMAVSEIVLRSTAQEI